MSSTVAARTASLGGRRIPLGPAEGWLTVALVVLGALAAAWAIDDAAWVLGRDNLSDFLAPVAVLGALTGFVLAKLVPMRWVAHLLGAVVAALVIPVLVGAVLDPDATGIVEQFRRTAESTVVAYIDLTWRGATSPASTATSCGCWACSSGRLRTSRQRRSSATIVQAAPSWRSGPCSW